MAELTVEERFATPIAEKYRLDRVLGDGGFGVVYAGEHEWTGRPIAVKVMDPALARQPEFVKRFLREARVAARLSHPHVVDVLDMGRDEDGTVYLVLELLEGEDLAQVLKRNQKLEASDVLAHLLPVMDALADAHAQGVVHRDLKPANIFLSVDKRGRTIPKLLDFGIAKDLEATGMTQSGQVWGTPHFMSPEQAMGLVDIGPQIDVWGMAVVMYRALSGSMPYNGNSPRVVVQKLLAGPPPPLSEAAPDVPAPIAACVDRALSHDTDHRYQDMGEMLGELVRAATDLGVLPSGLEDLFERRAFGATNTRVSQASDVERQILAAANEAEARRAAEADDPEPGVSGVMPAERAARATDALPAFAEDSGEEATEITEGLHEQLEAQLAAAARPTVKDFDPLGLGLTTDDLQLPPEEDAPETRVLPGRQPPVASAPAAAPRPSAPSNVARGVLLAAVIVLFIAGLVTGTLLTIGQLG